MFSWNSVQAQVCYDLDYNIFLKTLSYAFRKHVEGWKLLWNLINPFSVLSKSAWLTDISVEWQLTENIYCSLNTLSQPEKYVWPALFNKRSLKCTEKDIGFKNTEGNGACIKTKGSTSWVSLAEPEMLKTAMETESSLSVFAVFYSLWCTPVLWFCFLWVYSGGGIKLMSADEGQCCIFILF